MLSFKNPGDDHDKQDDDDQDNKYSCVDSRSENITDKFAARHSEQY